MATTARSTEDAGQAFTVEERAAMKERAAEVRSAKRRAATKGDPEPEVLAKIAELDEPDRSAAARVHAIIRDAAPELEPRLWYGMPAYGKDGKAAVFFQPAGKFKARYATLGFNDVALLDDGAMWATAFAITTIDDAVEARIRELVVRAAG